MPVNRVWGAAVAFCAAVGWAQTNPAAVKPLRTAPVEKFTVNPGFRDWGPATIAGTTILAGNPTNRGGLFAVDMLTGKLKWTHRPVFSSGTASVSTAPAVSGGIVVTPYAAAYPGALVGVSLATGKEVWRGPDPAQGAGAAVHEGLAYIMGKTGTFYALEAATGREKWKVALHSKRAGCSSQPLVAGGVIYLTGSSDAAPADNYLFALDAKTGQERWRYRAKTPDSYSALCLHQPFVSGDTVFASGGAYVFAVRRDTGQNCWAPVEVRRPVEGRVRATDVFALVDGGSVLIGMTAGFVIAFDKESGATKWELPGKYRDSAPAMAVAGNVLYFQGIPASLPAAASATLHALDLDTRGILWSFSRKTAEPNWPFGTVTPVDGGLWVDSYQALIKLQ